MPEKPIVIELYELWDRFKTRFNIVSPQPKSFTLYDTVQPIVSLDGSIFKMLDVSDATVVVASGGSNVQTIRPPKGKIYIIHNIYYSVAAPVGDTTGSHTLTAVETDGTTSITAFYIAGNHSTVLQVRAYGFVGDIAEHPSDTSDQLRLMKGLLVLTYDAYLTVTYVNNTDADQSGTRDLRFKIEERIEGAK